MRKTIKEMLQTVMLTGKAAILAAAVAASAAFPSLGDDSAFARGTSAAGRLDLRTGTRIATEGTAERITYSPRWGNAASCTIDLGGSRSVATSEGTTTWTPSDAGVHTLTHTAGDETLSATFVVADSETTETVFEGDIAESTDWSKDKVILVDGIVTVKSGATLTIAPGAVVKFMDGAGIVCEAGGRCVADGVIFTHVNDDTVGGDTLLDGSTSPLSDMYVLDGVSGNDATQYRYHPDPMVTLSGTIAKNEVWRGFNIYHVTGNITVPNGVTLTIEPGAIIKFDAGKSLTVNSGATLNAIGTRAQPIVFTSIKDDEYGGDTNKDGDKTMPYPADWGCVLISGGNIQAKYCRFTYGSGVDGNQYGARACVFMWNGGSGTFDGCLFGGSLMDGCFAQNATFRNCIFTDCDRGLVSSSGTITAINCVATDNRIGLFSHTSPLVVRNSISSLNLESAITGDGGSRTTTNCYFGNDPKFLDAEKGDFRIADNSPCVDAADASFAPETDYFGQPRVNAPDIGICEVMPRNVTSDIDLVPQSVTADADAVSGQPLTINWTVANQGGADVDAEWRDTISLVSENGRTVTLGDKVITKRLVAGGTVSCSASFIVPAIAEGAWYPKVNVNSYRDVFEGAQGENNALTGDTAINVSTTTLDLSIANNGIINANSPTVLKLAFDATNDNRMVKFDVPAGVTATWGFGFMPGGTRSVASGSITATDVGVMFRVPDGATEVYVVLESDTTATYNLSTKSTKMTITSVTPATLPSSGTTTLTIAGAGFGENNAVTLVSSAGRIVLDVPQKDASGNLIAMVDCATLTAGATYDVTVESTTETGGSQLVATTTLPSAVTVTKVEGKGILEARLIVADSARQGRIATGFVEYANVGTADMNLPVFIISGNANGTLISLSSISQSFRPSVRLVGIPAHEPYRTLKCGERMRLPFYYIVKEEFRVTLSVLDETSTLVRDSVFPTWKDFAEAISMAADRLNNSAYRTYDYSELYANAMRSAYGQDSNACLIEVVNATTLRPEEGVVLQVFDFESRILGEYITDKNGRLLVSGLAAGVSYGILAKNAVLNTSSFVCTESGLASVTVPVLPYAEVKVSALQENGEVLNPVSGIALYDGYDSYEVNASGDVRLPDGTYSFKIVADSFWCHTNRVMLVVSNGVASAEEVALQLTSAGKISLEFFDETTGETITNVLANLVGEENEEWRLSWDAESCRYGATLPPKTFRLAVSSGYDISSETCINVVAGTELESRIPLKRMPFTAFPPVGTAPFRTKFVLEDDTFISAGTQFAWDFDGDGVTDSTNRNGLACYENPGTYAVSLKVVDPDGKERTFFKDDAVDVWEPEVVELSENTRVLDEASHLLIDSFDGSKMVLRSSGTGVPYYLCEGMNVVLPDDALHPYKIVNVEILDETHLVLSLTTTSSLAAYNKLRLSSVTSLSNEDYISHMSDYGLPLPRISISFTPQGGWKWNKDDGSGDQVKIASMNFDFHYEQEGLNLGLAIDWDKSKKFGEKLKGLFIGVYGRYHGTLSANYQPMMDLNVSKKVVDKTKYEVPIAGKTIPVGPIPGTLTIKGALDVSAGIVGKVSYEPQADIYFGTLWRNGKWSFIKSCTSASRPDALDYSFGGSMSVFVGPKVSLGLGVQEGVFGVKLLDANLKAGMVFKASAEKSGSDYRPDTYSAKLAASAQFSLDMLKVESGDWFTYSAYSYSPNPIEYPFWEWKLQTPLPQIHATLLDTDVGSADVKFSCFIAGGTTNGWECLPSRLDFGDGNSASVNVMGNNIVEDFEHTYHVAGDDTVTFDAVWHQVFKCHFLTPEKGARVAVTLHGREDSPPDVKLEEFNGSVPRSYDPNEMRGLYGVGNKEAERFVKPGEELTYTIYFENKTNATAAAQEVFVTNPLSEWLDWSTFKMHEVAFGDQIDLGLVDKSSGTSEVTMKGTNFIVRTELVLEENSDAGTRDACPYQARWYMRIVDPTTDTGWPKDILAGFLPPNDETFRGEGHLTFHIKVRDDAPAGLVITNSASIVFDYNDPIETDPAWWNTVAPKVGNAKFNEAVVETEEGSNAVIRVMGGNVYSASSVKVYLTYNTAAAADVDLGKMKFPLALSWEKGEVGEKVITIPVKTDKTVEGDEFFTLQLAEAEGMELGEERVCTVTIRDATVAAGKETLQDAVNNAIVKMSTSGKGKWAYAAVGTGGEAVPGKTASASAMSPVLKASQTADLKAAAVKGSGTLTFDVRVANDALEGDSPEAADGAAKTVLTLFDGKAALLAWTNETDWTSASYTVEEVKATSHAFTWQVVQGTDTNVRAYVANVVWSPANTEMRAITLSVDPAEGGTVAGSGVYPDKTKLSLVATPKVGYEFIGWYDGETLFDAKAKPSVTVTNDLALTARFEKIPYIRGLADPADGGKVSGSGLCARGKKVTLKAAANKNFTFLGWRQGSEELRVESEELSEGDFVATTATLVIDRTAKPAADSKTSTTITNVAGDVTYYAVFKSDPEVFVIVDSTDGTGAEPTGKGAGKYVAGTITGMGKYAPGKTKIALKAAANKGYVFSGWYDANGFLLTKDATYTIASMGESDVKYTAKFVTADEDKASIRLSVAGAELRRVEDNAPYQVTNFCGVAMSWQLAADALSATTIKVAGLPAGLKFTAKDILKKGSKTEVEIPANTIYGAPTAASKTDRNGNVTPSKVVFTVTTAGKSTQTFAIDLYIDPLPAWAVGTFDGATYAGDSVEASGVVQAFTVAANGKISGKLLRDDGTWTLAVDNFAAYDAANDVYLASVIGKNGKLLGTNQVTVTASGVSGVTTSAPSLSWTAYQNLWKRADTKSEMPVFKTDRKVDYYLGDPDDANNKLTLTFKKDGAVAFAGKVGGASVSGSSQLVRLAEDGLSCQVTLYAPPKGTFAGLCKTFSVSLTLDDQNVVTAVAAEEVSD